jgi:hypothetical protein
MAEVLGHSERVAVPEAGASLIKVVWSNTTPPRSPRKHRPRPWRHIPGETFQAVVHLPGPHAGRDGPGNDVGEGVFADEGSEFVLAMIYIPNDPALRNAFFPHNTGDAAVATGFLTEPGVIFTPEKS